MTPHEKWLKARLDKPNERIQTKVGIAKFIHMTGVYNGYLVRINAVHPRLQLL